MIWMAWTCQIQFTAKIHMIFIIERSGRNHILQIGGIFIIVIECLFCISATNVLIELGMLLMVSIIVAVTALEEVQRLI